jgi:hypothetical protein
MSSARSKADLAEKKMSDLVCEICGSEDLPEGVSACEHEGDSNECLICATCLCSSCKMCNAHCKCSDEPDDDDGEPNSEESD